ncbi:hypothetical protein, conserved [Eimeria tenella]|uniref:Uncharacterized protein n=1 Tax=Eimeria tenella TaxID=5802 RepID=U6KZ83_EIMTE|nr:hypothetical protein, conserved [Eimeria tenella]CDJ41634.1 hypothetical protein, conserved [Eimeria tenella]|eukprot:XP_013232384.1 hypothetical protein, conserved [Eimeria tenella]
MNRSRHSVGPQRANGLSWSRGLFTVARLAFLLIAIFAPLSSSLSSVATEDSTVEVGTRFSLRAPLISKLNEVLTSLWTQITHNGEPVEISGSKAQELVETTIRRLRDSGEEVPDEFRDLLLWQLTSCFPIDENALRGIHGIFGVTSRVVCPANRTFSCALSALNIPLAEEERTPIQALEASICAAAIRHVGHDAAARLASQRGTGLGPEQVRNLTLEETSLSTTDEKTERLFIEGIQLQIEMQKGFQQLQWSRFGRAFKLASAFRLAQRELAKIAPDLFSLNEVWQTESTRSTFEHMGVVR